MLRHYRATRQFIRHLSKAIPSLTLWHPVSETAADVALIATITKGRRRRVNCVRASGGDPKKKDLNKCVSSLAPGLPEVAPT